MKLEKLVEHVINALGVDGDASRVGRHDITRIARTTIEQMGFHLANDGEICDPRPQTPREQPWEAQRNVRFAGSGSRLRAKGARGR